MSLAPEAICSASSHAALIRLYRALAYHIFTSTILLLRECEDDRSRYDGGHDKVISVALNLLDQVSSKNAIAKYASAILRDRIDSIGLS